MCKFNGYFNDVQNERVIGCEENLPASYIVDCFESNSEKCLGHVCVGRRSVESMAMRCGDTWPCVTLCVVCTVI